MMALTPKVLLQWCQKTTTGFPGLGDSINDFTTTWQSGLAFCAILVRFHPKLLDYYAMDIDDWVTTLQIAFDKAETVGIPRLLSPSDLLKEDTDKMLVMTYLSQYHKAFSHLPMEPFPPPPTRQDLKAQMIASKSTPEFEAVMIQRAMKKKAIEDMKLKNTKESDKCFVCKKAVYIMAKVILDDKVLHRDCFKCAHCHEPVTLGTYGIHDSSIYCSFHLDLITKIGSQSYNKEKVKRKGEEPPKKPKEKKVKTLGGAEGTPGDKAPKDKKEKKSKRKSKEDLVAEGEEAASKSTKQKKGEVDGGTKKKEKKQVKEASGEKKKPISLFKKKRDKTKTDPEDDTAGPKEPPAEVVSDDDEPPPPMDSPLPASPLKSPVNAIHSDSDELEEGSEEDDVSFEADNQEALDEIHHRQLLLSRRGHELENVIRKRTSELITEDEEDALFSEWFDLVNEKNTLVQQEDALRLKEEARKLQELGQYIDSSLRRALEKEDKTQEDLEQEEWLVQLWLDTVRNRDALVREEEEQRKAESQFSPEWARQQVMVTIASVSQVPETKEHGSFYAYEIRVVIREAASWTVRRRYTQFREGLFLKKPAGNIPLPAFPGRKLWNDGGAAQERVQPLQNYLQALVDHVVSLPISSPLLSADPMEALIAQLPFLDPVVKVSEG